MRKPGERILRSALWLEDGGEVHVNITPESDTLMRGGLDGGGN